METTKARLDRIPQILKTFRQSVLAAAVSGKLTEEWYTETKKLLDVADFQNGYAFKSGWFLNDGSYQVIKLDWPLKTHPHILRSLSQWSLVNSGRNRAIL
mgnify:CR=1 FL=1